MQGGRETVVGREQPCWNFWQPFMLVGQWWRWRCEASPSGGLALALTRHTPLIAFEPTELKAHPYVP